MVYELRSYDIDPNLIEEYLDWANDKALPILVGQFGFRVVGFWRAVASSEGPAPTANVHWIINWKDEAEMLAKWDAARASAEWIAIRVGLPKYNLKSQRTMLKAIPRSPLQ